MVSLIEFHFNSKYLFFVLIFAAVYCIRECLCSSLLTDSSKNHPLFFTLVMFLAEISCGAIEIVKTILSKSKKIRKNRKMNGRSLCLELILLLIIVAIDFTVYTIINLIIGDKFNNYEDLSSIVRLIEIFVLGIVSSKILNTPIKPHHIVCIFTFIILIFISIIIEGIKLSDNKKDSFNIFHYILFVIITICVFTIDSFQFTFEKYLVDKQFYSPFLLLMYMGIIGIICLLFVLTFAEIFSLYWTFGKFFSQIGNFSKDDWGIISGIYICGILLNASLITIIQQLGTEHVGIGNALGGVFLILVKIINNDNSEWNRYMIVKAVSFIVILIVCLVYTEIVVLNVFSLGDYTKGEIDKRGTIETRRMESQIGEGKNEEEDDEEENVNSIY